MAKRMDHSTEVVASSGDVFADLGIKLDDKDRVKLGLAREITRVIEARKFTQKDVARILKTDQAKVSHITRGRLTGFSVERLFSFLLALGLNVDIRLSETQKDHGTVTFHPPCEKAYG